jgi:drug/metabolite transporter (DMT)-like permease
MLSALGAAVCFGVATVLQAAATRAARPGSGSGVDARLLVRAARQWKYVAGLGLDTAGFALELVALRSLPIYAVGAALAASLAVTAVAASRILGVRLAGREWAAVAAVCGGLALLALASGHEGGGHGSTALRWGTLAAAVAVPALGVPAGRLPGRARAAGLGLGAGLGFGIVEVAVRLLDGFSPGALFANPALYALLLGGATGFLLLTSALQKDSVTTATAGTVVGETIGPALVGLVALHDHTRPGWPPAAALGFALALTGALALTRFGEVTPTEPVPSPDDLGSQPVYTDAMSERGIHRQR